MHFDAHLDTWPESFGQRFSHGQPFFHALEEGLVDPTTYTVTNPDTAKFLGKWLDKFAGWVAQHAPQQ